MEICIDCKKRPVLIKKRGLCSVCYHTFMRHSKLKLTDNSTKSFCEPTLTKRENRGEIEFIQSYFDHKDWVHQPAAFRLSDSIYTPDFYDIRRNVFIEVAATRQAYHQNKSKYEEFKKRFPSLTLEVRISTGELLEDMPTSHMWTHQTNRENGAEALA